MKFKKILVEYLVRGTWPIRLRVPWFDVFYIHCSSKIRGNTVVKAKPVAFADHCNNNAGRLVIIEEEQDRIVYEPAYYGKTEAKEHVVRSRPIYIAELDNVSILGGTGLVLSDEKVITDIIANDPEGRANYVFGAIRRANKEYFYLETKPDTETIDSAINLCGLSAGNYYHLTIEILSRYKYLNDPLTDQDIPVLIDEKVQTYPQFMDLVKSVIGDRPVIYVPEHRRIYCKHLIQPSMNTWMPINVKEKYDFRVSDCLVAQSAVDNIRESVKAYRCEKKERKIFVSRENTFRKRVINEAEVAELFRQEGFEVLCIEDLSYREQVELFSSASCVVGASGAAFTNLIYCNPGAVFGCIIPRKYNFCIYSSIAHMTGCKVLFLDAAVPKEGEAISLERCMVDLDECRGYIRQLEEMMSAGETIADKEA